MRHHQSWWAAGMLTLAAVFAGCGGATVPETGQDTDAVRKLRAVNEQKAGASTGDACIALGFYGDGVCDTFCGTLDSDCAPSGTVPILCAEFIEPTDGTCSRPDNDACRMQDPDCSSGGPTPGHTGPREPTGSGSTGPRQPTGSGSTGPRQPTGSGNTGGVVCAQYIQQKDGKCSLPDDSPCRFQDPDCTIVRPSPPAPDGGLICPAIYEPKDGVCPADRPCDPDCSVEPSPPAPPPTGYVCTTDVVPRDGVCPPKDPCDPDCSCAFVANGACQSTAEAACKALGCAPDRCAILESYPAQARCQ